MLRRAHRASTGRMLPAHAQRAHRREWTMVAWSCRQASSAVTESPQRHDDVIEYTVKYKELVDGQAGRGVAGGLHYESYEAKVQGFSTM